MWEVATPGPDYEMLRQRCCMRSQVELRLPPEPIAPTLARAAVAAVGSDLPEAVASDIKLLATEIVSNAVRHANLDPSEEIILRIVADGYVRVEVTDPGPPFEPELGRLEPGPSGWGLLLVDTIAAAWGVEHRQEGLVRTRLRPRPCYEMCENSVLAPLAGSRTSWASRWRFGINPSTRTRSRTRRTRSCSP